MFYFKAMPAGSNWAVRLAVFGDLGNVNPQSLGRLQEETQRGMYDAMLHVGTHASKICVVLDYNSIFLIDFINFDACKSRGHQSYNVILLWFLEFW